nr:MAG TPA: hypothetical protein [Caudoviricetes sp.]
MTGWICPAFHYEKRRETSRSPPSKTLFALC